MYPDAFDFWRFVINLEKDFINCSWILGVKVMFDSISFSEDLIKRAIKETTTIGIKK